MSDLPTSKHHWFLCTIEFVCPACKKTSTEKIVSASSNPDPDPIAKTMFQQSFSCQLCKTPLPQGVSIKLEVLPSTWEQLKKIGHITS